MRKTFLLQFVLIYNQSIIESIDANYIYLSNSRSVIES